MKGSNYYQVKIPLTYQIHWKLYKKKKAGHPIIQKHNGILSNFDKQVAGGVISATILSQNYHF